MTSAVDRSFSIAWRSMAMAGVVALAVIAVAASLSSEAGSLVFLATVFVLVNAGIFLFAPLVKRSTGVRGQVRLAAISLPIEMVRGRAPQLPAAIVAIEALPLFDASAPSLTDAWQSKDTAQLERLLAAGDRLNRESWRQGMAHYNSASFLIDQGRANLREQLAATEQLLAPYAIDYDALTPRHSGQLGGTVPVTSRQRDLSQKLNYSGGVSKALSSAATGTIPWQFAAVIGAGAVVMHLVNKSRALRQLKEMEGTILLNAEAARGDFALMVNLIETRLTPQLDRILAIYDDLANGAAALRAAPDDQRRREATQLAMAVVEGRHLLNTLAGD